MSVNVSSTCDIMISSKDERKDELLRFSFLISPQEDAIKAPDRAGVFFVAF